MKDTSAKYVLVEAWIQLLFFFSALYGVGKHSGLKWPRKLNQGSKDVQFLVEVIKSTKDLHMFVLWSKLFFYHFDLGPVCLFLSLFVQNWPLKHLEL